MDGGGTRPNLAYASDLCGPKRTTVGRNRLAHCCPGLAASRDFRNSALIRFGLSGTFTVA